MLLPHTKASMQSSMISQGIDPDEIEDILMKNKMSPDSDSKMFSPTAMTA
jgi:hypothetical protein